MNIEQIARDLLSRSEIQIANYREYRRRTGADFNVFRVVNRATDEVHGHSAFIAELLNPAGSHGQGSVFLNLFFETLGISHLVESIDHWQVAAEASQDVDGRIDILLSGHGDGSRRFGIAIENKVYAGDQDLQLTRYRDYLKRKYGSYQSGTSTTYLLYYLTLDGYQPSAQSVSGIPAHELAYEEGSDMDAPVRLLSYAYHIVEWLKVCRGYLASFPYAREVLAQYLDLVNALTGNGESMTDTLQNLLDTPDKLYAAAKLSNAVISVKQKMVCDLWDRILDEWPKRVAAGNSPLRGNLAANRHLDASGSLRERLHQTSKERFSKARNVPRWFGVASRDYLFNGTPVGIEFRFDNCFYVGLYGVNEEKVLDRSVVNAFYAGYSPPPGCKPGYVDGKVGKERIYVQNSVDFGRDDMALFDLVSSDQQQRLVTTLFEIAEGILLGMRSQGLTYKS
ncbi:hypothetical protein C2E25_15280 [Geothermobacter hydrogeniphilus]|uniref:PD-(D/E)XK nuclease superfamily protein n=1 Tax=Geothermobacter hydrogeniphilus TaxID=1969733 RepID=A0A2K2H6I2_9BACT|nr:PD-(D/E)XK nuclease family protein [Geothermobacter hydrogeniphilus]PNU18922.1 hypothetical protein C2E25_15280 [Geothermobacter hydrogeniphilus]